MTDAIHTLLVFCLVMLASIFVVETVKLIHSYRLRVNRDAIADAEGRSAKLAAENAMLWSQVTANARQVYVNTQTINRLMSENDALAKENDDFRKGTPVKEPIRFKRIKH